MTGTCEDAVCRYGKGAANRPDAFARDAPERLSYRITNDVENSTETFQRTSRCNRRNFIKLRPRGAEERWTGHSGQLVTLSLTLYAARHRPLAPS